MNHILLAMLTAPLSLLLFGAWRGITFNGPNYELLLWLYLFLLFTLALERLLSKSDQAGTKLPYKPVLLFGIFSIALLGILFFASNPILFAILLLYFIYTILQYRPYSMANTFYEILLRPFFKIFILSALSFFSQANFIPLQLQYEVVPLILFHIFVIILIQIRNTEKNSQSLTSYQHLLRRHGKILKLFSFLLAYATGIFQTLNLNSPVWALILFLLSALLALPVFKKKFQHDLRLEQYLSNYSFLFTLAYSLLFLN